MSERAPLLVFCEDCQHIWPAIWLPAPISAMGTLRRMPCPNCAAPAKRVSVARQDDIPRYRQQLLAELRRLDCAPILPPRSDESEAT